MTPRHLTLIGCSKQKGSARDLARYVYRGELFKKALAWGEQRGDVLILSAKHHVLHPDTTINPYELSLSEFTYFEMERWDRTVSHHLDWFHPSARITVLAGERYCGWVNGNFKVSRPLEGLFIGQQLAWLKHRLLK